LFQLTISTFIGKDVLLQLLDFLLNFLFLLCGFFELSKPTLYVTGGEFCLCFCFGSVFDFVFNFFDFSFFNSLLFGNFFSLLFLSGWSCDRSGSSVSCVSVIG
jgi:hypothetical protein